MFYKYVKLVVWDELIIKYPMAWYQLLHAIFIGVILCLVYHILSQNKLRNLCCYTFLLCYINMVLVMRSFAIILH